MKALIESQGWTVIGDELEGLELGFISSEVESGVTEEE